MSRPQRPRFDPLPYFDASMATVVPPALEFSEPNPPQLWIPIVQCAAPFPADSFATAALSLIRQPEQNSTLILRADIHLDKTYEPGDDVPDECPRLHSDAALEVCRVIRRTLVPRRPGRDGSVEQLCTLYSSGLHGADPSCLIITPLTDNANLPYYHPAVHHLAIRFNDASLRVEAAPLPSALPITLESRLYRTSTSLLDNIHRYCWGTITSWEKRVNHDILVPRDAFQDLYLVMRQRHEALVGEWLEETDPQKHVFEELAIACYLMLLWKNDSASSPPKLGSESEQNEPWKLWPRPPAFLDLGCGAGHLTHILTAEGYEGYGIDVRSRRSWAAFSGVSPTRLRVHALDPPGVLQGDEWDSRVYFPNGVFLIGNHSDELTPWLPVLAALTSVAGYLSIPCCAWALDSKFKRNEPPPLPAIAEALDVETLWLPRSDANSHSSYEAYRVWLGRLSITCGFEIEADNLRIPSSRNWAIVGRKRRQGDSRTDEQVLEDVRSLVRAVEGRFIARSSTQ